MPTDPTTPRCDPLTCEHTDVAMTSTGAWCKVCGKQWPEPAAAPDAPPTQHVALDTVDRSRTACGAPGPGVRSWDMTTSTCVPCLQAAVRDMTDLWRFASQAHDGCGACDDD